MPHRQTPRAKMSPARTPLIAYIIYRAESPLLHLPLLNLFQPLINYYIPFLLSIINTRIRNFRLTALSRGSTHWLNFNSTQRRTAIRRELEWRRRVFGSRRQYAVVIQTKDFIYAQIEFDAYLNPNLNFETLAKRVNNRQTYRTFHACLYLSLTQSPTKDPHITRLKLVFLRERKFISSLQEKRLPCPEQLEGRA